MDEGVKDAIIDYIRKRLAPKQIKIRSDIEVTCFTYEGIDAIKVKRTQSPRPDSNQFSRQPSAAQGTWQARGLRWGGMF